MIAHLLFLGVADKMLAIPPGEDRDTKVEDGKLTIYLEDAKMRSGLDLQGAAGKFFVKPRHSHRLPLLLWAEAQIWKSGSTDTRDAALLGTLTACSGNTLRP
jgi:hypothetical protein